MLTRKGVADRESAKRGSETTIGEGEEKTKRSPRNTGARPEDMIREVKAGGEGAAHEECGEVDG